MPFKFSKCAAGKPAKFSRGGVEFLGVIGTARLECDEPAAKASELIPAAAWQQLRRFLQLSCGAV
jgi:hypothetical protein